MTNTEGLLPEPEYLLRGNINDALNTLTKMAIQAGPDEIRLQLGAFNSAVRSLRYAASRVGLATRPQPVSDEERDDRFWLVLHDPGRIPERKGPWRTKHFDQAKILREFMAANPTAYVDLLTLDCFGDPQIDHGPQWLQILDARSMGTGRKHNERTSEAHAPYHGLSMVRGALEEIANLHGEINPSNYDHDDACELNRQFCYAQSIAASALSSLPPHQASEGENNG